MIDHPWARTGLHDPLQSGWGRKASDAIRWTTFAGACSTMTPQENRISVKAQYRGTIRQVRWIQKVTGETSSEIVQTTTPEITKNRSAPAAPRGKWAPPLCAISKERRLRAANARRYCTDQIVCLDIEPSTRPRSFSASIVPIWY